MNISWFGGIRMRNSLVLPVLVAFTALSACGGGRGHGQYRLGSAGGDIDACPDHDQ